MRFDFHCHSDYSDGSLSPAELVEYAVARDIQLLALTDHDCVSGIEEAETRVDEQNHPLEMLHGVEISAKTEFGEVHVVGLGIDKSNAELNKRLAWQQEQRWLRAEKIDAKLKKCRVEGVFERVKRDVKLVVTRPHIAKAIVDLGFAKDMQQAFKRFIGKTGRARVSQPWLALDEVIALIKGAGGVAVLAHPTRYPLSNRKLALLIEAFSELGGQALEMAYPSLNKDKMQWLEIHRQKHDLMASSGSDFHYPDRRWTDMGRFPLVAPSTPHVLAYLSQNNRLKTTNRAIL